MRVTPRTRYAIVGFLLASAISFILPDVASSAGRSFRRSAKSRGPAVHLPRGVSRSFHHSGFFRGTTGFLGNKSGFVFVNGLNFSQVHQSGFLRTTSGFLDNKSGVIVLNGSDRFSRGFHHSGFGGLGGFGGSGRGDFIDEGTVIIIQHPQSAGSTHSREPAANSTYVDPEWVDGGHGVEVLKHGHWTSPNG